MFENCPLRYYRQRVLRDVTEEDGEASLYGKRIHKLLETRLTSIGVTAGDISAEITKYEPLCQSVETIARSGELYIEHQMTLTPKLTPTDWDAEDAWLRSILDVLVVRGSLAVNLDWKTGKRKNDPLQLDIFAAQVFKHFPEVQTVRSSLVWLQTLELDTSTHKRADLNVLWGNIMPRTNRIEQAHDTNVWPPKPSGLCNYCPARFTCPYALRR